MARIKTRTMANYFQNNNINTWRYVKDGLNCWSKSGADFECKVECPYNERKPECDCHTAVSKDALDYINELEEKLADAVQKSEYDAAVSAVDNSTKEFLKLHDEYQNAKREIERLEKENAELLISETTELHISMEMLVKVRTEHPIFKAIEEKVAREIFEDIEKHGRKMQSSDFSGEFWDVAVLMSDITDLKKKYTEEKK